MRKIGDKISTPPALLLASVLVLALVASVNSIYDPDFWWHLRSGQIILSTGHLISHDPFTYTVASHHWIMHEWLTEVIFALLYRTSGLALIIALLGLVTWLGILCIYGRARFRCTHYLPLGLAMALGIIVGQPIWGPRAQMITFALTCFVLYVVDRHLRIGGRLIWCLVPLMLVWSNLHSGFVIGLGFFLVMLTTEFIRRWVRQQSDTAPPLRPLLITFLACTAIVIINPNGPGIYLYPFETQGSPAQQAIIQEWHSPDFHLGEATPFEIMLLSLIVMVVVNRSISLQDATLAIGTTALALQSVRHIALFVAAVTPLWAQQADLVRQRWQAYWRQLHRRAAARYSPPRAPSPPVSRSRTSPLLPRLILALTVYAGILVVAGVRAVSAFSVTEDSLTYARDYPVCAVHWLDRAPSGLHIFNQYGEGGYLADHLSVRGDKVFIFGDAALMGDPLLLQYATVEGAQPQWENIIQHAGTDMVLFDTQTPLDSLLTASAQAAIPGWIEVYHDPLSVAYVPVDKVSSLHLPPQPTVSSTSTCGALARLPPGHTRVT